VAYLATALERYKLSSLPLSYSGKNIKYNMTEQDVADFIKNRIDNLAQKYEKKGEQLLYEQGLLLGLLAVLSMYDSKNFEIIRKKLDKLE
jgi:hypothetical protein